MDMGMGTVVPDTAMVLAATVLAVTVLDTDPATVVTTTATVVMVTVLAATITVTAPGTVTVTAPGTVTAPDTGPVTATATITAIITFTPVLTGRWAIPSSTDYRRRAWTRWSRSPRSGTRRA